MSRRFITELGERETINDVFLASEKQLRTNKNGNYYLQLRLADRTGVINGMMWNATDHIYKQFENGDYVRIEGTTQFYNGNMQLIVSDVSRVKDDQVVETDFVQMTTANVEQSMARIAEMLRSMSNHHLLSLAECYLVDESLMDKLSRAPAGIKNHHAYRGGLLEHILNLMEVSLLIAPRYEEIDGDLLLIGAFLHDLSKVDELTYARELGYSDEGQMIGHMVMGVSLLEGKIEEARRLSGETMPVELALRLKHMIVSHHGQYEYGSSKLPMTPEAVALHHLDNLDAKVHAFGQLMRDDPNVQSNWTPYQPSLQRKLFKGSDR